MPGYAPGAPAQSAAYALQHAVPDSATMTNTTFTFRKQRPERRIVSYPNRRNAATVEDQQPIPQAMLTAAIGARIYNLRKIPTKNKAKYWPNRRYFFLFLSPELSTRLQEIVLTGYYPVYIIVYIKVEHLHLIFYQNKYMGNIHDPNNKSLPATHVVTVPNTRPATPLDQVKVLMGTKEYIKEVTNYFRGNREEAMAFLTSSIEYIRKVPKLLSCDRQSLLSALVISAQFRLMPSGVMGESYIVPYGAEAKFQLGYQGLNTLIWRTDKIRSIKGKIVYSNEQFEYEEGLETTLIHKPMLDRKKRGEPIAVYTVAHTTNGGRVIQVMSKDDVMEIKEMSKAKDKPESPWNSKDPELWMWKKTCLIQMAKFLPKTKDLIRAIEKDYEGEGLNKPMLDAGGPAVGAALHSAESQNNVAGYDE